MRLGAQDSSARQLQRSVNQHRVRNNPTSIFPRRRLTMQVQDDNQPGGTRTVHRRFTAPFARASREVGYRLAWGFLGAQPARH